MILLFEIKYTEKVISNNKKVEDEVDRMNNDAVSIMMCDPTFPRRLEAQSNFEHLRIEMPTLHSY